MKFLEIAPDVYQLRLRRANVTVLIGDEITVIDTGIPGSDKWIIKFLGQLGHSPDKVKQIIITHHHIDHIGGLAKLKKKTGASVLAHRFDMPYINGEKRQPNPFYHGPMSFLLWPVTLIPSTRPAPVDIILEEGDELNAAGRLKVIHLPGHTQGSIALFSEEKKILIAGDALNRRGGKLSFPPRNFTFDPDQAKDSTKKITGLEFDVLCFGHGKPLIQNAREEVQNLLSNRGR
ncbi:MAG: MBL fold metallo-hydrolase [Chloroflexota bacterium]|nr:MBL fold metallo-hydrolase [Chloroflexota bacterium]